MKQSIDVHMIIAWTTARQINITVLNEVVCRCFYTYLIKRFGIFSVTNTACTKNPQNLTINI